MATLLRAPTRPEGEAEGFHMYVLEADPSVAPRATLLLPDGVHSLSFLRGIGHDQANRAALESNLTVYCDDDEILLPDWFFAGVAPIASDALVHALRTLGVDNLETFPVLVESDDGVVASGFQAVNVIGRVAAIDLGHSRYTTFEGELFKLETMRLREKVLGDLLLFRPDEWTMVILVREELARAIASLQPLGVRLRECPSWVNDDF
jgi:hypothetical protein